VQGEESLVGDVAAGHDLQGAQAGLEVLQGAQSLQAAVLQVHAPGEVHLLQVLQTLWGRRHTQTGESQRPPTTVR